MFVGLRCFVRITETRRLHTDDYWVIAAFILLTANAVLQTLQTPSLYYLVWASAGRVPAGEELIVQGSRYTYFEFVIIALFWTITWSVKSSFLAMYWRLFDGLPNYRKVWFGVVIFAVGSYIGCWFASVWTCHPPSTYFKFGEYYIDDALWTFDLYTDHVYENRSMREAHRRERQCNIDQLQHRR